MRGVEKMVAGRVRLFFSHCFFGTLATGLRLIETESVPTAGTDGKVMVFNPNFTDKLSKAETETLLVHEVLHSVLLSHTRRGNRDKEIWNQSTDFAINILLVDEGFTMIEGGLIDEKFRDWSAEKIYAYLIDNPKEQQSSSDSGWNVGEVMDAGTLGEEGEGGKPLTAEEMAATEAIVKSKIQGAVIAAKKAGQMSAGLSRLVDKVCAPKANWRDILQRFINEKAFNDWEWGTCHTRMLAQYGIVNPTLSSESLGHILIGVDTSGSVNEEQLAQFAGEINDVLENYDCRVTVLYCDTEINRVEEFTSDDLPLRLQAVGSGGTSAVEIYQYAEENNMNPACLIHLTDCYLNWDALDFPGFPVLVAHNTSHTTGVPDWVELVDITE